MYRSQQEKLNNEIVDQEDQFQFSGATLKLTSGDSPEQTIRNRGNALSMESSAILSGSDLPSPPIYEHSGGITLSNEDEMLLFTNPKQPSCSESNQNATSSSGEFFSLRPGQFERAINDCVNALLRSVNDTNILGSWLLTEVSHWDHERERVLILTSKSLLIIKYDFIALKVVEHSKVRLEKIDTILKGKLSYPQSSLVPRIEGITNGVTSLICGNLFCKSTQQKSAPMKEPFTMRNPLAVAERYDFSCFNPVERKDYGLRVMWNKGRPISMLTSWNPFADDIPWTTLKNHPVFYAAAANDDAEKSRSSYSVESFHNALSDVFSNANPEGINFNCEFKDGPILMENYVGIGAVIHNKNNFGFFKVRGKFSF